MFKGAIGLPSQSTRSDFLEQTTESKSLAHENEQGSKATKKSEKVVKDSPRGDKKAIRLPSRHNNTMSSSIRHKDQGERLVESEVLEAEPMKWFFCEEGVSEQRPISRLI